MIRGGWCHTGGQDCPHNVSAQRCRQWGWCAPGCDGDLDLPGDVKDFPGHIHELPVESFVYENCSLNVDTLSEFCTGKLQYFTSPTLYSSACPGHSNEMGSENRWSYDAATESFQFLRTEERTGRGGGAYQFTDWEREQPGAQYQGRQHSAFQGDSCYGDAGQ